jgi:hypothetical protein
MKLRGYVATTVLIVLAMAGLAFAQRDNEDDGSPTAVMSFLVVKDENGKPVRNAAVIMHAVDAQGKQGRGDLELKTDSEGKTAFDGMPYGKIRVQVLAQGFQTYGEDYNVAKPKIDITIKLKRPQGQFSIYDDHANSSTPPKQDSPPPNSSDKKPN